MSEGIPTLFKRLFLLVQQMFLFLMSSWVQPFHWWPVGFSHELFELLSLLSGPSHHAETFQLLPLRTPECAARMVFMLRLGAPGGDPSKHKLELGPYRSSVMPAPAAAKWTVASTQTDPRRWMELSSRGGSARSWSKKPGKQTPISLCTRCVCCLHLSAQSRGQSAAHGTCPSHELKDVAESCKLLMNYCRLNTKNRVYLKG